MKKKNILIKLILLTIVSVLSLILLSCDTDVTPTVYEDLPNGAQPVITSVDPPDSALAGVTEITINGSNFSADESKTIVYFNEVVADFIEVTSTKLVVKAPNFVNDTVSIKIAVQGAPLFSETYFISLKPAVSQISNFQDFELPYAVTTDNEDNIYFNLVSNGLSTGISKITTSGVVEEFGPKGGESFYLDLKYNTNGKVYGTRNAPVRALFASEAGSSPAAIAVSDNNAKLLTLDFDINGNIWVGGRGGNIYRVTPDETDKKPFPFEPDIQSLRVFDGYLYAAAKTDSVQNIWRFPIISSDSLGEAEEYYNLTANLDYQVNAITFSADGKLFMGTDAPGLNPDAVVYLTADKSLEQWYPNVIPGPVMSLAWDTGNYLYYVKERFGDDQQQIMKINMVQLGAPYYGRDN
jgi:hypothetical protein